MTMTIKACKEVIAAAEKDLGKLSYGQKFDLLMDNFPKEPSTRIKVVALYLHKESMR